MTTKTQSEPIPVSDKIGFVYSKGKFIKVLTISEAIENNDELIERGFKHTATLDLPRWIESLFFANDEQRIEMIEELRKWEKL